MKRTKYIPAIVTLTGCLAATVITVLNRYDALRSMIIILASLIVFYIAGLVIKGLADKYLVIEQEILNEEEEQKGEEAADSSENADSENEKEEKIE